MTLKVAIAQVDMLVGGIKQNCQTIIDIAIKARDEGVARVIVFPELSLMGYPPEDLLLKPELASEVESALADILEQVKDIYLVLGYPKHLDGGLYNCAGVLFNGVLIAEYHKQKLLDYRMSDDKRYFETGNEALVCDIDGVRVGLSISEDIHHDGPVALAKEAGAQVLFNLSALPLNIEKTGGEEAVFHQRAKEVNLPIIYVNYMGAQDEFVFAGGSFVVNSEGVKVYQAPWYEVGLHYIDLTSRPVINAEGEEVYLIEPVSGYICPPLSIEKHVYQGLVLGLKDYVKKNGFTGVMIGLTQGVGSALSLTIAVDALGADNVKGVICSHTIHNTEIGASLVALAHHLGVAVEQLDTTPMIAPYKASLSLLTKKHAETISDTRLEIRMRSMLLLSLAEDLGYAVLSSRHKSEIMIGAESHYDERFMNFAVLQDIFMNQVLQLCLYRNSLSAVIPVSVIQDAILDTGTFSQVGIAPLSSYAALDKVLDLYKEQNYNLESIVYLTKIEATIIARIMQLVDENTPKRRFAPLSVKVANANYVRSADYPMTHGWNKNIKQ